MPQAPSTRWCPTPEQLMILEEMYRTGIRTPNASQIQQITAHLSYYGKIEGKNVFYWFQNHKARDRQKLRRRLSRHQQLLQQQQLNNSQQLPSPPQQPQVYHQLELSNPPPPYYHKLPQQVPPQFLHQGGYEEANQMMNLVCKLETCEVEGEMEKSMAAAAASSTGYGHEWVVMMDVAPAVPTCCRPLKTLELFPVKSTGLKEECSTSKSTSCSASTN